MNDSSVSTDFDQFFGAYFHEDWILEADDWQGVVDLYVNDGPSIQRLRALTQEIETLRVDRSEIELEQLLAKIGVNYDPQPLQYQDWLGQVAERLRLHADAAEGGTAISPTH